MAGRKEIELVVFIFLIIKYRMQTLQNYISHTLNTSASKEAHLFPKETRFPQKNKRYH